MTNIKKEIFDMKESYLKNNNGKEATTLYITKEKENELFLLEKFPADKSPREEFPRIIGLVVKWESDGFYMTSEKI